MSPVTEAPPVGDEGVAAGIEEPLGDSNGQPVQDDPPADPAPEAPEGDHPGEGEGEQDQPPAIPPLEIEGLRQLSMKVGGERVDESVAKLRGGSVAVIGGTEFEKGALVDLSIRCRVAEVHFADKRDNQTGEVTGTIRRHILKPERVEKV